VSLSTFPDAIIEEYLCSDKNPLMGIRDGAVAAGPPLHGLPGTVQLITGDHKILTGMPSPCDIPGYYPLGA
jgi:hypothetical protein